MVTKTRMELVQGTPTGRTAAKIAAAIAAATREMRELGLPPTEIQAKRTTLLDAGRLDVREAKLSRAEKLQAVIERKGQLYRAAEDRRPLETGRAAERYSRRIFAMTVSELEQQAVAVETGETTLTPEQLDILAGALRDVAPERFQALKQAIREQRLDEPWLHDEQTAPLAAELDALNRPGVPGVEDGNWFSLPFEDLIEEAESAS